MASHAYATGHLGALVVLPGQDHTIGMDACLIGSKGVGKTSVIRRFASSLGYRPRTVYCYADLPARDLLQRRSTDENGATVWVDSEPVKAAMSGDLLILDNIHRLPPGTLAATLGRLLTDRELQLPDGRRLLPQARYDALVGSGELSADEIRGLVAVHPAFRVLATAETPAAWLGEGGAEGGAAGGGSAADHASGSWLSSESLSLFHFHRVPTLSAADHAALVGALHSGGAAAAGGAAAEAVGLKLLALRESLASPAELAASPALHSLRLTTRGLLRAASHAAAITTERGSAAEAEASAARAARREIVGPRGSLPVGAAHALGALMQRVGLPPAATEADEAAAADLPPPKRVPDGADGASEAVVIGDGCRIGGIVPPERPELVPEV